jgi:hypothetical protein
MNRLTFQLLSGEYSLCRLAPEQTIPDWIYASPFFSISKTPNELSIVCESQFVPGKVKQNGQWRLLKILEVLDLSLTGITAQFSTALADAGVNICVIATYDTDYVMVKEEKLSTAIKALENAGFTVQL